MPDHRQLLPECKIANLRARLWLLPQHEGGGEIVDMCDYMDIRWMTDDSKEL